MTNNPFPPKTISRRVWLFEMQYGQCYLANTCACRARNGAMRLAKQGGPRDEFATKDHVLARSRKKASAAGLYLLACFDCNNAKGSRDPQPAEVALAMALSRLWFALPGGGLNANSPNLVRELEEQVAAWQARAVRRFERNAALGQPADTAFRVVPSDGSVPSIIEPTPWVKSAGGEKVMIAPAKPKKAKQRVRRPYQDVINEKNDYRRGEPIAGVGAHQVAEPLVSKQERAALLGVTDARFKPGAKVDERERRNLESQLAATNGIASRAEKTGDKMRAHNMTQKAAGILAKLASLRSTAARGR